MVVECLALAQWSRIGAKELVWGCLIGDKLVAASLRPRHHFQHLCCCIGGKGSEKMMKPDTQTHRVQCFTKPELDSSGKWKMSKTFTMLQQTLCESGGFNTADSAVSSAA